MPAKISFLLLILSTSLLLPNESSAAIFKCLGADGQVSYNQMPCPVETKTAKVLSSAAVKKADVDCRIANNFARRTAMAMRTGQSSDDVFSSYGGIDSVPRSSIGIINYVFSHKGNTKTGANRIVALSAARCSGGAYGSVECQDFPYGFISDLGGCYAASMSVHSNGRPAAASPFAPQSATTLQPEQYRTEPSRRARTTSTDRSAICKEKVQAQISDLHDAMRSSRSASSQDKLRERRNNLRQRLNNC